MKFNVIKCKEIHMGRSTHNCTCIVMDSKWAAAQKMKFWSSCGLFSWDISWLLSFGYKDTSAYLALLEKNETQPCISSTWIFPAFLAMPSQEEYCRTRLVYLLQHSAFICSGHNKYSNTWEAIASLVQKEIVSSITVSVGERMPPHFAS